MKKLLVVSLLAFIGLAFVLPAYSAEFDFGGYWRTRAFSYNNFTGEDQTEAVDYNAVDTRTRIYFTAQLNDHLKFVNKFEFDADWGSGANYGDIGTDGKQFEIKQSYADFTMGVLNAKIGAQGTTISRGFLFSDDFAGAILSYNCDNYSIPFIWIKPYDGGNGLDSDDGDVDYYAVSPSINAGNLKINPVFMWATSDDISKFNPAIHGRGVDFSWAGDNTYVNDIMSGYTAADMDIFFLGLDLDADMGAAQVWFTGLYEVGTIDYNSNVAGVPNEEMDISAYLLAVGADVAMGAASLHGQVFYASGDDEDEDFNQFWVPSQGSWYGQSYYWAEIMGFGMMDDMVSNGSPGDKINNIMAANIGASANPMDKLTLKADLWYATLAEEDAINGEKDLGFEIDLGLTYELVDNLNLDIIAAYLFAGDRTTQTIDETGLAVQFEEDANPYELGARLSLSF